MKQTYRVGELAEFFGVSKDTIRLYDKMGLVSPQKNKRNNYRCYTREDLICMAYVMRLRKINLTLEEIDKLMNDSSIERAEAMMQVQEKILEDKIQELLQLKSIVGDYRLSFGDVIENLGKIEVKISPTLICKNVDNSMIKTMEAFGELTKRHVCKFTFVCTKKLFLSPEFNEVNEAKQQFIHALTMKDDDNLAGREDFPKDIFRVIYPRKCVCAIIQTYTNVDYRSFLQVRDYVLEHGYEIVGDILLRTISNRHNREKNMDYYEMWVPIAE